jgi:hypothetical protein
MTRFSVNLTADQSSFSRVARRTPAKNQRASDFVEENSERERGGSSEVGTGIEPERTPRSLGGKDDYKRL